MENQKHLTEENYVKGKRKLKILAVVILIIGVLVGGSLILVGLNKKANVNSQYSEENKETISQQLETEKQILLNKKSELELKIDPIEEQIKQLQREPFTGFDDAYYERKDRIEELEKSIATDKNSISVIDKALDESFSWCDFDEAKNNTYTSKYCSLKLQLNNFTDFNKDFDSFDSIPFYMFGSFVIILTCMIAGSIYMFSKRREIAAFTTQQVMPIAKEGIEKMAPTIGIVGKEIAKGISEGIEENNKDN